jgi:hypothetical protein
LFQERSRVWHSRHARTNAAAKTGPLDQLGRDQQDYGRTLARKKLRPPEHEHWQNKAAEHRGERLR